MRGEREIRPKWSAIYAILVSRTSSAPCRTSLVASRFCLVCVELVRYVSILSGGRSTMFASVPIMFAGVWVGSCLLGVDYGCWSVRTVY